MNDLVRLAKIDIMRYVLAHRDARDTLIGIEKWWLPQTRMYSVADIEAALEQLARHDVIRVWESTVGKPVYGLGPTIPRSIEDRLPRF